jgi:hypothetical protein
MSRGKADGKDEPKSKDKAVAVASKSNIGLEKKSKDEDDSEGEGLFPEERDDVSWKMKKYFVYILG